MKKITWGALAAGGLGAAALLAAQSSSRAADHLDSPVVQMAANSNADINDLYAWMSDDASKLNLVMTVEPFATSGAMFSDAVQYVFHVHSASAYGAADTETTIVCTFAADQTVQCWAGDDEYVRGDASATAGISSDSGDLRVFAGLRDDPFFFNLSGFQETVSIVEGAASGLTFDADGCPELDQGTSDALVTQLMTEPGGGDAVDDFAGASVLALVVQVDAELVTPGGPIAGVWASTRAAN